MNKLGQIAAAVTIIGSSCFASASVRIQQTGLQPESPNLEIVHVYSAPGMGGNLQIFGKNPGGNDVQCIITPELAKSKGHDLLTLGSLIAEKKINFICFVDAKPTATDYRPTATDYYVYFLGQGK